MKELVLQVSNVSKSYRQYRSELLRFMTWFGLQTRPFLEQWVLRGVSFSLVPGEAVGIVGQNGAGKSTLLKIVAGTQRPTEGSIRSNGRVAAILELGMGFNPEFTGRQNAYHVARLMGFRQDEIERVMPEIEDFAEIDTYFDQPMSTYSSGMHMRVAFSVVTAFRPDILIVDEALSVGDTYFQHKSFNRIRSFREQGTTLLIVSHDRSSIQALCSRAILLDKGVLLKDDTPDVVMDYYNALIAEKENETVKIYQLNNGTVQTTSGTGEAKIVDIALLNDNAQEVETVFVGQLLELQVTTQACQDLSELVIGYLLKDRLGQDVFGTNTFHTKNIVFNVRRNEKVRYRFKFPANLGPGSYSISIALHTNYSHLEKNYEWRDFALMFNVVNIDKLVFTGINWLPPDVEVFR